MIAKDDIVGLELIYKRLESSKDYNMAFFSVVGDPNKPFEKQAIANAIIKALEFLLKNKIITSNAIIEDNEEELSLLEYATKKLNEAKES